MGNPSAEWRHCEGRIYVQSGDTGAILVALAAVPDGFIIHQKHQANKGG
jgi:hypothetical protein